MFDLGAQLANENSQILYVFDKNWLRLFEQFPAKDKWTSAGLLSFSPMLGVTQCARR